MVKTFLPAIITAEIINGKQCGGYLKCISSFSIEDIENIKNLNIQILDIVDICYTVGLKCRLKLTYLIETMFYGNNVLTRILSRILK